MKHTRFTASVRGMILVCCVWMGSVPSRADPSPRVVASIKPIHALVSGVMRGVGEPELLLPGSASPHAHALRPSEMALLTRADLIFWVGAELETFLIKPLQQRRQNVRIVTLHQAPGIHLLPNREQGGNLDHHADEHGKHLHGTMDMHLWLDPVNASAMVRLIRQSLEQADPSHAGQYRENAQRLEQRIEAFTTETAQRLAGIKNKPFIVFHDAYHYFENRFGLAVAGFVSVNPERPISARRLQEIHTLLKDSGASCIFSEPQFEPALVDAIVRDQPIRKGTLDPVGSDTPMGEEGWFVLMNQLVSNLTKCLSSP
ncbi:MAG: zinc ABC transporter substrate-binding protein [Magnetococcales bacterium]|nr:zinc ABC transporter substrate-binding protein [Magnetococcales bacterium]